MTVDTGRPRILFLVTEDWYFLSHRLVIARAARDAGGQVTVVTRVEGGAEQIRNEGFRLVPLDLERARMRAWIDLAQVVRLLKVYAQERPDIVHQVGLKPVLYGTLAARMTRVPYVVNALGGLGYLFSSTELGKRAVRGLVIQSFRWLLRGRNTRIIVQNPEDRELLVREARMDPEAISMIRGAGVDLKQFQPAPEPSGATTVAMVSRMLREKGVGELIEAAKRLRERGSEVRVVLVGKPDAANPSTVSDRELREWAESGAVEWWGHRDDIASVWRQAHICALPSYYREGVPKSLLEAAACGRPIVTSDAPGCREVVRHGVNGLLVPARDVDALTDAIERLLVEPELRRRMGRAGRAMVEEHFGVEEVVRATMDAYRSLLGKRWPAWQLSEQR